MILSNEGIKEAIRTGAIRIDPDPNEDQYTTSAVDLTLAEDFRRWSEKTLTATGAKVEIDLTRWNYKSIAEGFLEKAATDAEGCLVMPPFRLHPWHFLAQTREEIFVSREHRIAARVEGRSSLARIGLVVHLTAPIIHSGWQGPITLEMINFGPFYLKLPPTST